MSLPQLKQPLKDSKVWYICWTDGIRSKRVSTRQTDLAKAQTFFAEWLLMERQAPAGGAELTCGDLWRLYEERHVNVNTAAPETLAYCWKNLEPYFAKLTLAQVDQNVVDGYLHARVSGRIGRKSKPNTVRKELGALRGCWSWCADPKRKIVSAGALPAFDLPPEGEPRDRWLKIPEMKRLLDAAAKLRRGHRLSRGERFLWLALETAARKEAIYDLTWDRVDFETSVIHYDVPGRKKTKKRRASVPISNSLRPILERAFDERESDLVLDNKGEVWPIIQIIAIEAGFGNGQEKPKHTKKPKATGISPHVLRHTAATHMARNGVPLWIIAGVLGNSLAVVEKTYAKHCPEGLRDGVALISRGLLEVAV